MRKNLFIPLLHRCLYATINEFGIPRNFYNKLILNDREGYANDYEVIGFNKRSISSASFKLEGEERRIGLVVNQDKMKPKSQLSLDSLILMILIRTKVQPKLADVSTEIDLSPV